MAINKIFLSGNLTKDVDVSESASGTTISKFSIAVRRALSKENKSDFFNCVVFGKIAENCAKYLKKGSKVNIIGAVQIENYEDKQGNKKQAVSVVVSDIEFLTITKNTESEQAPVNVEQVDEDLIPF